MADIQHLFSERAQQNTDFKTKVIKPTEDEINSIKRLIDVFPELISLDYMPVKFLKVIGDTFGYPYLETEDPEVQREIFKHLVATYKDKGSQALFEKAVARAYDNNYALGDLTYYRRGIDPGDFNITFPRDFMFQYDESLWNVHKISDRDTVALGIIDLTAERVNSRTETYLDQLIPAGIKYIITIAKDIGGDDPFPFPMIPYDQDIWILFEPPVCPPYGTSKDILIPDDRKYDWSRWDGRKIVTHTLGVLSSETLAYFRVLKADDQMYKASDIDRLYPDWNPEMADKIRAGYTKPRGDKPFPGPHGPNYDPFEPWV